MAILDFLHTPPRTCSPSTVSHLDAALPQLQCLSSTLTTAPRLSQFGQSDEVDSSDKENCPSHAVFEANNVATLNQTSKDVLIVSPAKQYMSFTPRREKPPPRAWERRPATPFNSRTEGQKIWKRIPLAELGVETNRQLSRREEKDLENYVRIVKRMKVNGSMDDNDGKDHESGSLGTKWEEDSIEKGGSPKKKSRADNPQVPQISDEKSSDDPKSSQNDASTKIKTIASSSEVTQIADGGLPVIQIGTTMAGEDGIAATVQASDETLQDQAASLLSGPETDNALDENESIQPHVHPLDGDSLQTEGPGLDFPDPDMVEGTLLSEPRTSDASTALTLTAPNESTVVSSDDLQNLLMQEIDTNKLSLNESEHNVPEASDNGVPASQAALPTSASMTTAFTTSDHDETAFLRDFLHRAQASKAARIATSPQKKRLPLQSVDENEQLDLGAVTQNSFETTEENEDDDLSPPIETARIEQVPEAADTKFTSPTRRGTRASTRKIYSRLPRSQTTNIPPAPHFGPVLPSQNAPALPSTIQLKRATGCEFIFNAKEQQTLAMMTRANTKKNQSGAVHVEQRLAQLKMELDALQHDEQTAAREVDIDALSRNTENDENKTVDVKCALKKRKRDREDDGKVARVKRNVKWPSDEQLARYREASPFTDSESLLEDGSLPVDPENAASWAQVTTESMAAPETTGTSGMTDTDTDTKAISATEESSKLKVRRIRKVKLDSVNGTPAPKTRSRSVIESAPDEMGPDMSVVSSIETSALKVKTRRSSRMPVPVATPIPLPSFSAAAKPKTRGAEKESANDTDKAKTHTEEGADTQNAQQDRKLDGRRKLRTKRG